MLFIFEKFLWGIKKTDRIISYFFVLLEKKFLKMVY